MREIATTPVAGEKVQGAGRDPVPGAAVPKAVGGGEHLAWPDQGAGAERAKCIVDSADGVPGVLGGADRDSIIYPGDSRNGEISDRLPVGSGQGDRQAQ